MPIGSTGTFLAADQSGSAACIEIAGWKRAVKRMALIRMSNTWFHQSLYPAGFPDPAEHIPNTHSTSGAMCCQRGCRKNRGQITVDAFKAFLDRDWATG